MTTSTSATFSIDASPAALGRVLPNIKSNVNRFGGRFPAEPEIEPDYNMHDFVKFVQLMACTGGNPQRDLFRDPADFSILDDYDFEPLLASCRGILKTGAKPLLKLGNVPSKLSRDILAKTAGHQVFNVNVFPPDDYQQYYAYIRAITEALVAEFGLAEVRSWRFGVLTEYENVDWFYAPSRDPAESSEAFCRLYDFTVKALEDVLGPQVFVGAHSMSVIEGLWDEALFIRHCASGRNYATGGIGTTLRYLAASYYEDSPGHFGSHKTFPETIAYVLNAAEAAGLRGLLYGIDEGRILRGNAAGNEKSDLVSRTVGDTYQAAFDARLAKQAFDHGVDYFSSWSYFSEGDSGNPCVSYHIARGVAAFEGARLAAVSRTDAPAAPVNEVDTGRAVEIGLSAAYDEAARKLYLGELFPKYRKLARPVAEEECCQFSADGSFTLSFTLPPHGVTFFTIA